MAQPTDLTGMLTEGLFQPTQQAIPSSFQEAMIRQAQSAGTGLRRGIGALTGADTMTNPEAARVAMQDLDINNPADQPKLLEIVRKYAPEKESALVAQFAQQGRVRAEKQAITDQQEAERSSLADFLELEYGDKGGRLRPAVMSGAITAGNVDKFVAKEEKEKERLKTLPTQTPQVIRKLNWYNLTNKAMLLVKQVSLSHCLMTLNLQSQDAQKKT